MKKIIIILILLTTNLIFCENTMQNGLQNNLLRSLQSTSEPAALQQQQLEQEKQNLADQKQRLDNLKSQLALQTQQMNILYPSQIASNNAQIQNLTDVLQNLRLAEKDINEATALIFRAQNIASQLARDQVDPGIVSLQQSILQTQQQIAVWTNTVFPLTLEQRSLLTDLLKSLTAQKQQLDNLTAQKTNISMDALLQTSLIDGLSQQQKADLIDSQTSIQDQIFFLRAEFERLQTEQAQLRINLTTLNQQINQAQKNYDDQVNKIKTLEATLPK